MVLVTGGTGMVGKAVRKYLPHATFIGRLACDLRDKDAVETLFQSISPKQVIHLGARVGGVLENTKHPYDMFYENIIINTNILDACVRHKVDRLVAMSSVCVYSPSINAFPISENLSLFDSPDQSVFGYGYAKRMMQVQLECAKKQFDFSNYCLVLSSNLYGPNDCFEPGRSHVAAALIKRFHDHLNDPVIEIMGTGKALRQLTYVEDLARFLVVMLTHKFIGEINFASPENLTIAEIAETISRVVGFSGEIKFTGGVDGILRRDVSLDKLHENCPIQFTPFEIGIDKTYKWFKGIL